MKSYRFLPLLLLAAHCAGSDAMYDPPGGKGFWARQSNLTTGSTTFYRVTSMFAASSRNADVYVETKRSVPKSSIDGLLAAFENNIVPVEHVWFTTPTDVDGNGKVIFLLLDIQDGYREGSTSGYIAGYFDPLNHYSDASVSAAMGNYHSNQAEMLYLDTYPADVTKNSFFATLAHEYQHLLQFGKYYRGEQNDIEPTWLDEGLSEVASDLTGYGPQTSRAHTFRDTLLNATSLIKEPNSFGLENYAMSYIYFRYLADVYGLGTIASIFNDNQIGVSSVNSAIQRADSGLTTSCGNPAGLSYAYFGCSYRYMWAAMINGAPGDSPVGATVVYNGVASPPLTSGSFDYRMNVSNTSYAQELTTSLANGSVLSTGTTGALQSYAMRLYKNDGDATPPGFNGCSGSPNPCGLTAVVGSSYFVIFNHDANTSVTHSATVVDSLQSADMQTLATESITPVEPVTDIPLEHRAMHWHFPLSPAIRPYLE